MKLATHIFEVTSSHAIRAVDAGRIGRPQMLSGSLAAPKEASLGFQLPRSSSAIRIVGILAFCQSLIFLVIWLLVCSTAGAATKAQVEFTPELKLSTYEPVKVRDPFARLGGAGRDGKATPSTPIALQLEGILYQSTNPSAIVNGKLVTLNKIVTLNAGNGEVQVKAVEITRESVLLDVGGQRVELRLSPRGSQSPAAQ